jgi:hypothetical protein
MQSIRPNGVNGSEDHNPIHGSFCPVYSGDWLALQGIAPAGHAGLFKSNELTLCLNVPELEMRSRSLYAWP